MHMRIQVAVARCSMQSCDVDMNRKAMPFCMECRDEVKRIFLPAINCNLSVQ